SPKGPRLSLYHGLTAHGGQYVAPELRSEVSGYYGSEQAVREAIEGHPRRLRGESIRVAVIGLGVGNLAALGRPGDLFRFYEIDPEVVRLAEGEGGHFSFLKDSPAQVEVVLGDGRISLERELASGAERFDVLVLDAFSGDAIPVHLLTREAFDIYLARLRDEESVITAHVSNRYFQLVPVVWEITRAMGLSARVVDGAAKDLCEECSATWMVVARDEAGLQRFGAMKGTSERLRELRKSLWTDDYASLFDVRQ
ncbi:MAG: spermidine synthase, partial [Myxococcales bacterium]